MKNLLALLCFLSIFENYLRITALQVPIIVHNSWNKNTRSIGRLSLYCSFRADNLVDIAQISLLCNSPSHVVLDTLVSKSTCGSPAFVKQQFIEKIRFQYNIINYFQNETRCSRFVLSFRGCSNIRNFILLTDAKLEIDEYLNIFIQSGYKTIFHETIKSFPSDILLKLKDQNASVELNGHSMGGVIATLFGMYLSEVEGVRVTKVVVFGMPAVRR